MTFNIVGNWCTLGFWGPLVLEKASPGKKQQILRCPQGKFESVWQHISPCYSWKSIPNQGYVCSMIMFNPTKVQVVFNMSRFNILSRYQSFCQSSESQNTMLCRAVWSHFAGALWKCVAVCELLNHHAVWQNRAHSPNREWYIITHLLVCKRMNWITYMQVYTYRSLTVIILSPVFGIIYAFIVH